MQVAIRTMGNSKGVLIPKPILEQTGLLDAADLQVVNGVIEIRPLKRGLREGHDVSGIVIDLHQASALGHAGCQELREGGKTIYLLRRER